MAPDRGGLTATLDPVADRPWSTATLNPIPDRGTLTAILDGGKQILASATCMGAVAEAEEGGLVICIPTNKHGDSPGVAHDSACSKAKVDNHSIAIGQRNHSYPTPCKQALPQCTDSNGRNTRSRQTIFRQTDFNQLQSSPQLTNIEAKDGSSICKYVNIKPYNVKHNFSRKDAYHDEIGARTHSSWRYCTDSDVSFQASHAHLDCHTPLGKGEAPVSNWLRAVKPEVECSASLNAEESWPPLLACRTKGKTSGSQSKNSSSSYTNSQDRTRPLFAASYEHKDVVHLSNMEYQSKSYTGLPYVKPEVLLDEQTWPSLEKSCKHGVLHDGYGSDKKRRILQPLVSSNFHHPEAAHTMQGQRRNIQHSTPHGGFHKTEKLHIPPLLLMLNKDFIVTSPLKENLLLTLALMGKRSDVEAPESLQGQTTEGETKRQILVGQFKAFSSFLHFVLGRDATRVRTESNAGGTSTISESLSVEYFVRRFQAKDIVTEMEVEYCSFNWKKVDYICTLYGQRVGVSVTRAMSFPDPKDFSAQMAYRLLYKKLFGLVVARHGVSKRHSFSQCILHVWCETQQTASIMQREYDGVSQELDIADDVVMVLTVADGCHARPIFYESLLKNA